MSQTRERFLLNAKVKVPYLFSRVTAIIFTVFIRQQYAK